MKALVLHQKEAPIAYQNIEKPTVKKDEVLVELKAAALNHRDVYITQGLYPGIKVPMILGSDGSGTIVDIGQHVSRDHIGREVIIRPGSGWSSKNAIQGRDYKILGLPDPGCLAEYISVPLSQVIRKPAYLNWEQAAALPLAGLTAYRSLFTRGRLRKGDRVLISGVGGGVALMACQLAVAAETDVWVTSGTDDKIEKAIHLGAQGGVNYKRDDWHKILKNKVGGGFDLIIDSAGGEGFTRFTDLANMSGRIVFYGGTRGNFTLNPQKIFWKQLDIMGSTMGSDEEFDEMISFVERVKLVPHISNVFSLEEGVKAFEFMNKGKQFGKIVIRIKE